jgi:hypothetical protein
MSATRHLVTAPKDYILLKHLLALISSYMICPLGELIFNELDIWFECV